ncbi:MAG: anaerobic ribonucleoside-triphosphate reductase activating protein [Coriobacteriales bacterium]|jgi:anaerobic ribonucleoside-triphosphate reductase activating protein|nr:anaerobic ribonucleoside-triphosphate reductase activating protein [Coriobacteriales bacterium]
MTDKFVNLFGIADDSIVDGPGVRLAIFTQGCAHNCEGCHNPQAQAFDGGILTCIDEILDKVRANPLLAGITLTGGEPFEQAEGLLDLARVVREECGLTVWAYSGYLFEQLLEGIPSAHARKLLQHIDVLVDGPFIEQKRSLDLRWRGSANQRVIDVQASIKVGQVVLWQQ